VAGCLAKLSDEATDALQENLYKGLADAKWDLWMFAKALLAMLLRDHETVGVRWLGEDSYDLYDINHPPAQGWWPAAAVPGRTALYQRTVAGGRIQAPTDGVEERILYSIIDVVLGCLRPSPGSRFSAMDVKATLLSPQPGLDGVLGDYYLAQDLLPIDANGREVRFVYPFAGGFFGDVYHARIGRSNVRCVVKRMKDKARAADMLEEIRLVCQLQSEYIVAYLGAVYEDGVEGQRPCCGFLMERMDEDLLSHMRRSEYHTGSPPSVDIALRALRLLLDVAEGLRAIHTRPTPILHRDLHIRNVLLANNRAKLSDFGCGKAITADVVREAHGQTYAPGFIPIVPPEASTSHVASSTPHCVSYDMYGYGLLMAQVIYSMYSLPSDCAWEELSSEVRWKQNFVGIARTHARTGALAVVGEPLGGLLTTCIGESRGRPSAVNVVETLTAAIGTLTPQEATIT
jgi:hypothetical protein